MEDWTPACVYEEAIAKEQAKILFFVIDNTTRALASMIEVIYSLDTLINIYSIVLATTLPPLVVYPVHAHHVYATALLLRLVHGLTVKKKYRLNITDILCYHRN